MTTVRDCLFVTASSMIRYGHLFLMMWILTDTAQAHNTVHHEINIFYTH